MDTSNLLFPKPKDTKRKVKQVRRKACEIPKQVRMAVAIRDNGKCIFCGKAGISNAHLVKRSQGGLGIEENIFTACPECHYEEDFGKNSKEYEKKAERYLKSKYGASWDRKNLVFRKGEN